MSNDTIFYTQIGSVVVFLIALFTLYRLLVDQKDAVISVLKERIALLEKQLENAKYDSPDVLATRLANRVELLTKELTHLSADKYTDVSVLKEKSLEMAQLQREVSTLREQLLDAEEKLKEDLCPWCGAELQEYADYLDETNEIDPARGSDMYSKYKCGTEYMHGGLSVRCLDLPTIDGSLIVQLKNHEAAQ